MRHDTKHSNGLQTVPAVPAAPRNMNATWPRVLALGNTRRNTAYSRRWLGGSRGRKRHAKEEKPQAKSPTTTNAITTPRTVATAGKLTIASTDHGAYVDCDR